MVAGEGTFLSPDDPDLLLASRPGLPRQEKNGMKVDDVLSVKQVDIRHGHVIFEGALIVAGDVTPGMKIKTSGDVVIGGFVEGLHRIERHHHGAQRHHRAQERTE